MKTEMTVEELIQVFADRRGFDDWWDNIDEDDQEEIKQELGEIVESITE